jgi:predicted membrane channel-forming protein YqfA (hemolysin III family)
MQQPFTQRPSWRYGFLAVCLVLLASSILIHFEDVNARHLNPNRSADFSGIIVALMLLINHVAFQLVQSPRLKKIAKIIAIAFLVFGLAYILSIVL